MKKGNRIGWRVRCSMRPDGLQPTRLLCPWDFPGKSPGVRTGKSGSFGMWHHPRGSSRISSWQGMLGSGAFYFGMPCAHVVGFCQGTRGTKDIVATCHSWNVLKQAVARQTGYLGRASLGRRGKAVILKLSLDSASSLFPHSGLPHFMILPRFALN